MSSPSLPFEKQAMEKPSFTGKALLTHLWFLSTATFFILVFINFHYYSTLLASLNNLPKTSFIINTRNYNKIRDFDSCLGKYIYMYDLPSQFNHDLLKNCEKLLPWANMCSSVSNRGFGPLFSISDTNDSYNNGYEKGSWFETDHFILDVIFHHRIMKYKCLTKNPSIASALYVPFYAGVEVGRNLWGVSISVRDFLSLELVKLLGGKPEWRRMMGRDHFLVSGRISWDLRRETEKEVDWGNKLMFLPESRNMTLVTIETGLWNNDIAIPYPTYFHPKTESEIILWQNRVSVENRKFLFSFAGAPRPTMKESIRSEIIKQCEESSSGNVCKLLSCNSTSRTNCRSPVNVINLFRSSDFCLQPSGDSYTRRSIFDSILAGCIPVFFNDKSAHRQYLWHLPKNHTTYSVLMRENDVRRGKVKIKDVLRRFGRDEVVKMRNEVIKLIPKVVYSDGGFETIEDAFDIAVNGILERVESIRKDILKGRNSKLEFGKKDDWN